MEINFLAVNDQLGNTAGSVRAVKAFKSLSLDRTSINCQVGWSFTAWFFSEIRDFCHFEDMILSVGVPMSDPQNVRLSQPMKFDFLKT
jgi:hypothetical protein